MSGRLILVRHGETEGNVAKILDTRVPGLPLTERGAAQAKTFGASLSGPPRALLCSEALRARQTAGYIEASTGVPAQIVADVHEVQVGDMEGESSAQAHSLFQRIYRSWHAGQLWERTPGGESGYQVLARFLPVLEQVRTELIAADSGDVLLVNHGAAMRLVARFLTGVPLLFATNNHLDNTETIELAPRGDGGWDCTRWGRYTPPFGHEVSPTADDPMG